ncbi:hypothetical protein K438DRAFT_1774517 [Mycena galopus ATCC 62051]|nr:hypothetical protein K438DRAFT_1774517 [Mycena galopus ATCC 62051]
MSAWNRLIEDGHRVKADLAERSCVAKYCFDPSNSPRRYGLATFLNNPLALGRRTIDHDITLYGPVSVDVEKFSEGQVRQQTIGCGAVAAGNIIARRNPKVLSTCSWQPGEKCHFTTPAVHNQDLVLLCIFMTPPDPFRPISQDRGLAMPPYSKHCRSASGWQPPCAASALAGWDSGWGLDEIEGNTTYD